MKSINPATGETIREYQEYSEEQVERAVTQAHVAFRGWRRAEFSERGARLKAAAAVLRKDKEALARMMAQEMGKPVAQGCGEIEKCAWACDYFADESARFLAKEIIRTAFSKSYVAFQPLGIVLGIMPWNFPFWQVFRAAAPALMAGNAFVLKHASNVPGCALALEEIFKAAEFPQGLFRTLLLSSSKAEKLIAHPFIQGVTLTGSSAAGAAVAAKAGAHLKKTVLELGGSDPYVILADADLKPTVETCVTARLVNSGQSCIAAKRFIVARQLREQFEALSVQAMKARKVGNPFEAGVTVGPLARHDLRDTLHSQVERSTAAGARLLLGGTIPPGKGAFYPPTVLSGVNKGMPAYDEETFGPVAAIIEVADEEQAAQVANDTEFGLGAAVFTRDLERGEQFAQNLDAGCCLVNDYVRSDPRLPFGGVKHSGYGRELSLYGIREFVNIKTICVK